MVERAVDFQKIFRHLFASLAPPNHETCNIHVLYEIDNAHTCQEWKKNSARCEQKQQLPRTGSSGRAQITPSPPPNPTLSCTPCVNLSCLWT